MCMLGFDDWDSKNLVTCITYHSKPMTVYITYNRKKEKGERLFEEKDTQALNFLVRVLLSPLFNFIFYGPLPSLTSTMFDNSYEK